MSNRFERLPVTLFSPFNIGEPNDPIKLYEGPLQIDSNDRQKFEGRGVFQFQWFPSPRPQFVFREGDELWRRGFEICDNPLNIHLLDIDITLAGRGTSLDADKLTGVATDEVESKVGEGIKTVEFYIANLRDIRVENIRDDGRRNVRSDRTTFLFDEWEVIIENLPNKIDTYKALRNQGGYAITHIDRSDAEARQKSNERRGNQIIAQKVTYLFFLLPRSFLRPYASYRLR